MITLEDDQLILLYQVRELENELKNDFPQLETLDLVLRSKDNLFVNQIRIRTKDRGKGYGSVVMRIINDFAKKHGMYVTLFPYPDNVKKYKKKLEKFYKKLGYQKNVGKNKVAKFAHPTMATMIKKPLNEEVKLPPDMDKKAEILGGFIASFFIRYFESRVAHTKTKSDEQVVKYAEYYRLAKQYRDLGKQYFAIESTDELTSWGKATYRIRAKDESMPHVILKIASGYSTSHDGYVDESKYHAEVYLLVDTYHFIKSFKKSTADTTVTLKHEILHCLQMTEPETGEIGKMRYMPKDKVMSKTADVYGTQNVHGYQARHTHGMRDIEFKPNLLTYSYYIKTYLNRNHPAYEWKETFKDIIRGSKTHTANEVINNYSEQLGKMMRIDKTRWKQFVKELSAIVFK